MCSRIESVLTNTHAHRHAAPARGVLRRLHTQCVLTNTHTLRTHYAHTTHTDIQLLHKEYYFVSMSESDKPPAAPGGRRRGAPLLSIPEVCVSVKRDPLMSKRDLRMSKRDLLMSKRGLLMSKRDLLMRKRDLLMSKRDLLMSKRDLLIGQTRPTNGQKRPTQGKRDLRIGQKRPIRTDTPGVGHLGAA